MTATAERPAGVALVRVVLARLADQSWGGGVNGTCYECPFASEPMDKFGNVHPWHEVANDPTEAHFRCSLPGRSGEPQWGELAPCTEQEWAAAAKAALDEGGPMARDVVSIRLSTEVVQAVDAAAEAAGLTRTDVVERVLRRGLRLPDGDALDVYLDGLAVRETS